LAKVFTFIPPRVEPRLYLTPIG